MAVYNKATRTAKGRAYDASVNADEFQAQYSFMYISSHDYTAADVDALTKIEDIVIKAGVSDVKKNSDVAVSVYAPYTNAGRKTSFELRTIGLMATHPTDGLILHSIVTASVPDTVPEDDGANLVDETFQFILEEVNADNTNLVGNPSGLVTMNIFNEFKTENTTILGGKAEAGLPVEYELPLVSTVENTSGFRALYFKDPFERVTVSFHINKKNGSVFSKNDVVGMLPVGFRPGGVEMATCVVHDDVDSEAILVAILVDGSVVVGGVSNLTNGVNYVIATSNFLAKG